MRFLFAIFLAAMPTVQGPGEGYNLAPSSPREIKTLYWELFQTTEIWVRISPDGKDHKPSPVSLIFYVTFSGKELSFEPTHITIRAQADPRFVASKFSLKLSPQPGAPLDLVGPPGTAKNSIGTNFQYYPNCPGGGCAVTGVISYLPWKVFLQIARSESLTVEALGIEVSFHKADFDALRAFAKTIFPLTANGKRAEGHEIRLELENVIVREADFRPPELHSHESEGNTVT